MGIFKSFARFLSGALIVMITVMGGDALAQSRGKITVWVGSWWEPQVALTKQLWSKDHPDVVLDIQPLPINGYLDKFTAAALGGSPPDVIDLDTTWVSTVAALGLLQPLTDVAAKLTVADISPAVWMASRFKGVQYAIPNRSGPGIYYYNKTVFDRAGVPYPGNDWTYDDFLRIVQEADYPGPAVWRRHSRRCQRPVERDDDVRSDSLDDGRRLPDPRWERPGDQQSPGREGDRVLGRPLSQVPRDARGNSELHDDARHPAALRGEQGRSLDRILKRLRFVLEEAGPEMGHGPFAEQGQPGRRLDDGQCLSARPTRMAPRHFCCGCPSPRRWRR